MRHTFLYYLRHREGTWGLGDAPTHKAMIRFGLDMVLLPANAVHILRTGVV